MGREGKAGSGNSALRALLEEGGTTHAALACAVVPRLVANVLSRRLHRRDSTTWASA